MEQANARITYLEQALQKKREDLEKEEENLSKTLAIVQQLAEENIKSEDVWMEEKAFLENKIDDMEKEVSDHYLALIFRNARTIFPQMSTLRTVVQTQDKSISQTNEEKARAIVRSTEHDQSKTSLYIEEYAALLEKYTTACVIRSAAETMAIKAKECAEEQVKFLHFHV